MTVFFIAEDAVVGLVKMTHPVHYIVLERVDHKHIPVADFSLGSVSSVRLCFMLVMFLLSVIGGRT